jgi:hypothetical protein
MQNLIQTKCKYCSKKIMVNKHQFDRGRGKFCSMSCRGLFLSLQPNHFGGKRNVFKGTHTAEARKKMSDFAKNRSIPQEIREKISRTLTGKSYLSIEARKKMSLRFIGDKNPSWKGGLSKLHKSERRIAMNTVDYQLWRTAVFMRDNYTCQICGQRGLTLNADHVKPWYKYPELRYAIDNGRTLCVECHRQTDTYAKRSFKFNLLSN